ncbi:MAG: SdiA-regulated domain-containing protein [Bacteroidota bacterium]|nr:SdiA-regulated domain-containing protein [Bacteroidota bacterium]
MYKLSFIAMSVCAAAMALACQQEKACLDNEGSDNQEQTFTFTIAQDDLDTKAGYNSDNKVVWKSGDKILVHGEGSGSSYRQVVTLSSSNISSDGLTATVNVPSGLKPYDRSDKGYISKYYAQYPADAAPDGKLYYFSVFNSTNKIMRIGCDDGNKNFTFYNVTSSLSFKVKGDFDEYAFYGNDGETIGYKHYMARYVQTNSGVIKELPYTGSDLGGTGEKIKKIYNDYLTCDGSTKNYVHVTDYIDFNKGITIDFYKNGNVVATYTTSSVVSVKRGRVTNLGDITSALSNGGNPGGGSDPGVGVKKPYINYVAWSKKLKKSDREYVVELSGLCLSEGKDFLWGVGDNGHVYKINLDGSYSLYTDLDTDLEGVTMHPDTKDLYVCIEPKRIAKIAASSYNSRTNVATVTDAENYDNSGLEGITWYKGNLLVGSQTGAYVWAYSTSGSKVMSRKSLRDIESSISEVADLYYDSETDLLWVLDSEKYKIFIFNGAITELVTTVDISDFADWNPESIFVDHEHNCVWIADDCSDENPSILHKVIFHNL